MIFQRRPFILIEVLLAIALLTLCAFPIINASLKSYRYQRDQLIELQLERQAELAFYNVLKEMLPTDYDTLKTARKPFESLGELKLPLEGVEITYYPHFHLYYSGNSSSINYRKLLCRICFPKEKGKCTVKNKNFPYRFDFLVKKVAEKSIDPHGDNRENSLLEHERPTSDIQTLHSSE